MCPCTGMAFAWASPLKWGTAQVGTRGAQGGCKCTRNYPLHVAFTAWGPVGCTHVAAVRGLKNACTWVKEETRALVVQSPCCSPEPMSRCPAGPPPVTSTPHTAVCAHAGGAEAHRRWGTRALWWVPPSLLPLAVQLPGCCWQHICQPLRQGLQAPSCQVRCEIVCTQQQVTRQSEAATGVQASACAGAGQWAIGVWLSHWPSILLSVIPRCNVHLQIPAHVIKRPGIGAWDSELPIEPADGVCRQHV